MSKTNNAIKLSLKKGLHFLGQTQKKDGSFESLTSPQLDFNSASTTNSIFPTCLILSSLANLPASKIQARCAQFLLKQKSPAWTFNYWKRNSADSKRTPYPEDLDDTFCALSALMKYDKNIISGQALAKIVALLNSLETKEGGPYRTWITTTQASSDWKDVDLAVNSNIAYFLSLNDVFLPNLIHLADAAIAENNYASPYYASPYSVIYFISRFYPGQQKQKLINYLRKKKNPKNHWNNPLDTALAISALINLGYSAKLLEKPVHYLITQQKKSGPWPAVPFVVELIKDKKKYYSGSDALTTAFCLEALQKYLSAQQKKSSTDNLINRQEEKIKQKIILLFKKRFSRLDKDCQKILWQRAQKTMSHDKNNRITLLAWQFKQALGKKGKSIPEKFIVALGLANWCGWLGYEIYDDFLDEEGVADQLPVANLCYQALVLLFSSLTNKPKELIFFQQVLEKIEAANFWETTHCRAKIIQDELLFPSTWPDYKNNNFLFEKSLGHALGPIFILFFLDYSPDSSPVTSLLNYFRFYLMAKQLQDDAHDWQTDVRKGFLTPVVSQVLVQYQKKHRVKKISLKKHMASLQKIFWHQTVVEIYDQILDCVKKSRKSLAKIDLLEKHEALHAPLDIIEKSAQHTLQEQKNMVEFLKSYKAEK